MAKVNRVKLNRMNSSKKQTKYIFFDIDNTLFPTSEFAHIARENAIRAMIRMGLDYDENKLMKLLLQIVKQKGSNYNRHFNELCSILGIPKKEATKYVSAAIGAYHDAKSTIQPYPDVPKTLLNLKLAGYNLYIATDGKSIKQWDKLIRIGIGELFTDIFTSEDLKVRKSVQFYEKIQRKLNAKPSECIMIGDREDMDIIPAKKTNWKTILVQKGPYGSKIKKSKADYKIKNFYKLMSIIPKL